MTDERGEIRGRSRGPRSRSAARPRTPRSWSRRHRGRRFPAARWSPTRRCRTRRGASERARGRRPSQLAIALSAKRAQGEVERVAQETDQHRHRHQPQRREYREELSRRAQRLLDRPADRGVVVNGGRADRPRGCYRHGRPHVAIPATRSPKRGLGPGSKQARRAPSKKGPESPDPSEPSGGAREVGAQFPDRQGRISPPQVCCKPSVPQPAKSIGKQPTR